MSLRLRVTLLALVALVAGLLAGGVVVPVLVSRFLTDRLDEQLQDVAPMALRLVDPRLPGFDTGDRYGPVSAAPIFVERRDAAGDVEVAGFTDGRDLDNPPQLPDDLLAHATGIFTVDGQESGRYRVVVATTPFGGGKSFAVAIPMSEVDATVRQIITIEVVTIAVAVIGVAGLTWWLVGLGLRPLRRMEATAETIAEKGEPGEGERIEHASTRTELGKLGSTLNTMLDRIDESFAAQRATEVRLRRFAADASHELRTPLTSIRGYAELYRRGGDTEEQIARSMTRIEEESARMGELVEDLLTLTRLDEGRPLAREPVDLSELVAKAVEDARVVDGQRAITISAPEAVVVQGDGDRLMQVVVNLLANVRAHTPAGTPATVRVGQEGSTAVVEVEDHGPGLAPEQAEQVFERFYRADPARTRAQGGSGLGLAIVDAVVRAHGGEPSVAPTPGGGATFRVTLPLEPWAGVPSSNPHGPT